MGELVFQWIDPDLLEPMINMRLNKSPEEDFEFKADIALRGVQQNMKIRTHPDLEKQVEGIRQVYIGRRRLHAVKELKKEGIGKGSVLTKDSAEIIPWEDAPILCPTILEEVTELEAYLSTMSENVSRKDVTDMETGNWINMMMLKFNMTAKEIAEGVGKTPSWASRKLEFYKQIQEADQPLPATERQFRAYKKLPKTVQDLINEDYEKTGAWPSSREMELHGLPTVDMVLAEYSPEQVRSGEIDKEFLTHMLLEKGYKFNEAKRVLDTWLFPKTSKLKLPSMKKNIYTQLGVYYTPNLLDSVFNHHDSENAETLIRYARRLTGAILEEIESEKVEKIWMKILA